MKTIWKYPYQHFITMPIGAQILTVQMQDRFITIWALVDPEQKHTSTREIEIYGTGDFINEMSGRIYIGTVQENTGFVWHLFEVIPSEDEPYHRCPNVS